MGEDSGWETRRGTGGVHKRKGKEMGVIKEWDEGEKGKLYNNRERLRVMFLANSRFKLRISQNRK